MLKVLLVFVPALLWEFNWIDGMTQQSQQQQILSLPPLCIGTIWTVSRLAAVWAARRSARCTGAGSCLSGQEDCCEDKESLWGAVAGNLERRSASASTVVASKRVLNLETGCYGCLRLTFPEEWCVTFETWNLEAEEISSLSSASVRIFFCSVASKYNNVNSAGRTPCG